MLRDNMRQFNSLQGQYVRHIINCMELKTGKNVVARSSSSGLDAEILHYFIVNFFSTLQCALQIFNKIQTVDQLWKTSIIDQVGYRWIFLNVQFWHFSWTLLVPGLTKTIVFQSNTTVFDSVPRSLYLNIYVASLKTSRFPTQLNAVP